MSKESKFKGFLNFYLSKPNSPTTSLLAIFRYGSGDNKGKVIVSLGSIQPKYWYSASEIIESMLKRSKGQLKRSDIDKRNITGEVIRSASHNFGYLNDEIKKIKKIIENTFEEITESTGDYPTDQKHFQTIVKAKYKNIPLPNADGSKPVSKTKSLIEYAEKLRDDIKNDLRRKPNGEKYAEYSYKSFHNIWYKLDKYREYRILKDILFTDINLEFYYDFRDYVVVQQNGSPNYFGSLIKNLKTIMLDAMELGFHNNEEWKSKRFIKETTKSDTIYLNDEQLEVLFNLDLPYSHLQNARDLFLIGCWTGLRFSDFNNINKSNIEGNFLKVDTQKTKARVTIPIQENLRLILDRIDQIHSISNQKLNSYLKDIGKLAAEDEIGKKAGFNKSVSITKYEKGKQIEQHCDFHSLISSHTARRSFATNMFLLGVPSLVIMAITGHSTERAFLTYIKANNDTMANIMMQYLNKSKT